MAFWANHAINRSKTVIALGHNRASVKAVTVEVEVRGTDAIALFYRSNKIS